VSSADAWEVDDDHAADIEVGIPQARNFHSSNDVDYVKFYAVPGYLYEIKTTQQGTNVNTVLDVFWEQPDETLVQLYTNVDDTLYRQ